MKRRVVRGVVALLLVAVAGAVAGAEPKYQFRAFIQPDRGITDTQPIRLVLQFEGGESPEFNPPTIPELTNLRIIGGPDRRFNTVWSNGRFSSTSQLVYTLLPDGPGPAEIPALTVRVGSETYRTQPIRLSVSKGEAPGPPPGRGERLRRAPTAEEADVFLVAEIGSKDVWVGQSVPLSVSLHTAERVSGLVPAQEPALSSFWVETLQVDPEGEAYPRNVGGQRYQVYPLVRKVLVPQAAGDFTIEPFVMQMDARLSRSSGPFELFSFGRTTSVIRKTEPLELKVRPLPKGGRPDGFSGAVGDFTLKASLDRNEAAVNDAVALTASIEGEGSLRAVTAPLLRVPPDVKLFDPKISSGFRTVRGRMVSKKTWEWVLVPLVPGEIRLAELELHYFDPDSGSYKIARSGLQPLMVYRSDDAPDTTVARGDIQVQRRDLAYIKLLRGPLREESPRIHERGSFIALLCLPLLWVPLVVALGRHRARLQRDQGLARGRRARSRARRSVRAIRKRVGSLDAARFHEEVARALVEYVADRFDRSAAGLTYELADDLLASRGIETDLRRRFRSCLETCDFARFVPEAGRSERRAELLDTAGALVEELERSW